MTDKPIQLPDRICITVKQVGNKWWQRQVATKRIATFILGGVENTGRNSPWVSLGDRTTRERSQHQTHSIECIDARVLETSNY